MNQLPLDLHFIHRHPWTSCLFEVINRPKPCLCLYVLFVWLTLTLHRDSCCFAHTLPSCSLCRCAGILDCIWQRRLCHRHKKWMIERRTTSSLCDSVPGPSHKSGFCSVLWMQPRYPQNQNQPVWLNLPRPVVWSRLLPGDCRVVKAKINQTFTNCKFSKCSLQIIENLCLFIFLMNTSYSKYRM